ncbi:Tfp pilus assembly protein FimT/FimU [Bacteriovorax sp. Seq25_V]|uniref:pilus assembly FimT family protein n=1 Tax=Bacteriovorax sp. Seq25_V TaxID=1201288 RepID=UPI00038A3B6C|nr:type II secretion system protein [Bacteriovorax sp. Seq25_V]EQC46032.1 prepilin-type cleavage/methylation N-terminal domain protein [Bacteriovorax sp. Seq25_V]
MIKGHEQSGFTLLEILVALALVTIVLMMVAGTSFSSRQNLDEMLNKVERIVRFASDEASLKNQFIRLSVELDTEEQKIKLEYADDANLVLEAPKENPDDEIRDDDKKEKKKEEDKSFSTVSDFDSDEFSLPVGVKFVAIGTSLSKNLIKNSTAPIYFYPTGEKDSAIIIFATDTEIATVEIKSFGQVIDRNYYKLDETNFDIVNEKTLELADGLYKEWLEK